MLQDHGNNKIVHADAINAFVAKLKFCNQRANNKNFASFHRLNDIAGDNFEQSSIYKNCRMSLNDIFRDKYFWPFNESCKKSFCMLNVRCS